MLIELRVFNNTQEDYPWQVILQNTHNKQGLMKHVFDQIDAWCTSQWGASWNLDPPYMAVEGDQPWRTIRYGYKLSLESQVQLMCMTWHNQIISD